MISIFVMYSPDRRDAMEHTLSCLKDMELYNAAQKTLVVDESTDWVPAGWELVRVPRVNGKFCWGRMWDAGVCSALHDKIVYLDSDRLLPKEFISLAVQHAKDNTFLFTSKHFHIIDNVEIELCKKLLESRCAEEEMMKSQYLGRFRYEIRLKDPYHGPAKNVMSGSTVFTRDTYYKIGGVDHWYKGHGAFADTDFHYAASLFGCRFIDLGVPELHFPHKKLGEAHKPVNQNELAKMGLDNFVYYCHKWRLPIALAEGLASRIGIDRPARYVSKKLKELS